MDKDYKKNYIILHWTKYIGILSLLHMTISSKRQGSFLFFSVDTLLVFYPFWVSLTLSDKDPFLYVQTYPA